MLGSKRTVTSMPMLRQRQDVQSQLVISDLVLSDQAAVFDLLQDPLVMRFIGPRRALNAQEAAEWFGKQRSNGSRFAFRHRQNGDIVGFCGISQQQGCADFGYFLRRCYWGQGLAQIMCQQSMAQLAATTDFSQVLVFIAQQNVASVKLAQRLGWQKTVASDNAFEQGHLYRITPNTTGTL